jgi:DNA-binding transcriptional regulator YiaG
MNKQGIDDKELAEIFGVSVQAVWLWLEGERKFTVTNTRLVRLFQKYPQLLKDF